MIMKGFAALFVIVVLGAASLIMAVGAIFAGLGTAETAFVMRRGNDALSIADGCVEAALLRLRSDSSYSGGNEPTFLNGSCTINITGLLPTKTIDVNSASGDYNKRIRVIADISVVASYGNVSNNMNTVRVISWSEISD